MASQAVRRLSTRQNSSSRTLIHRIQRSCSRRIQVQAGIVSTKAWARKKVKGPSITRMAASAPYFEAGTPRLTPAKTASQRRQTRTIMGMVMASQIRPIRS
jgi:hypothetical protein